VTSSRHSATKNQGDVSMTRMCRRPKPLQHPRKFARSAGASPDRIEENRRSLNERLADVRRLALNDQISPISALALAPSSRLRGSPYPQSMSDALVFPMLPCLSTSGSNLVCFHSSYLNFGGQIATSSRPEQPQPPCRAKKHRISTSY